MSQGWTVVVRRRGSAVERELWDCAIASPWVAEKAVRRACGSVNPRCVSAYMRLTPAQVRTLDLAAGEIRRRVTASG